MNAASPIDIPGYELIREIGRGESTRVYLATQTNTGRRVAIKVIPRTQGHSEEDEAHFLQQARKVMELHHPRIVRVFDAGAYDTMFYLVMEYLPEGTLASRMELGLSPAEAVSIVREIALGLDFIHSKGLLHLDIKPGNILLRNGAAALSDFGLARPPTDDLTITPRGTVHGSPGTMSPEQASGGPLDHRSDLYSLGVVLHQMLTGIAPHQDKVGAPDSEPSFAALPSPLVRLQPIMDRFLAKAPDDRLQSGREIREALDAVPIDVSLPSMIARTDEVATAEIEAISWEGEEAFGSRGESNSPKQRSRRIAYGVGLGVVVVVTATVFLRSPEVVEEALTATGLMEDRALTSAWEDAMALSSDPTQSLAAVVAAHNRVLDMDPDHEQAAAGIAAAAMRWKQDVRAAIDGGDLGPAEAKLNELIDLFPEDNELRELDARLSTRSVVERLLTDTDKLLQRAGFDDERSATSAIQSYQEVLRLSPGNPRAREALETLAAHYADRAINAARDGQLATAMNSLGRAATANPDYFGLEEVRAEIAEATSLQAEIEAMLRDASAHRESGALIDPPEDNAAEIYHRVLATDPVNSIAIQGLLEVADRVLAVFAQVLSLRRFDEGDRMIERAVAVGLGDQTVTNMKERIELERVRVERVDALLAEAEALTRDGYVTEPVGGNAVSRLREVLRLDPDNVSARRLLTLSATRLADVAQEAFDVGLYTLAREYLDLALTVTPGIDAWREKRERWARFEEQAAQSPTEDSDES